MIENYCFRFFMRPCWQQQLALLIVMVFLFLVSYCILLLPNQYRLHDMKQNLVNLKNIINRLNDQIADKPDKEELMVAIKTFKTTMKPMAMTDMQARLISITQKAGIRFKQANPIIDDHKSGWKIQLSGQYQQFVLFLVEFYKTNITAKIQHIEVKVESDQLLFSLVILAR